MFEAVVEIQPVDKDLPLRVANLLACTSCMRTTAGFIVLSVSVEPPLLNREVTDAFRLCLLVVLLLENVFT
jgi:hypothetical protein